MRSSRGFVVVALLVAGATGATSASVAADIGALTSVLGAFFFAVMVAALLKMKRDVLWVVVTTYLVAPGPANNLLPSVDLFPPGESSYGAVELVVLPDLVLLAALASQRGQHSPAPRFLRLWVFGLFAVALTGFAAGLGDVPFGVALGQSLLWVRLALVSLLAWRYVAGHGTRRAATTVSQALVLGSSVLAIQLVLLTFLIGDNVTLGGFVLSYDGRVRLPGWGNNVAANAIIVGIAVLLLNSQRLPIGRSVRAVLVSGHLVALVLGETRLSLVLAGMLLLVATLRAAWGKPVALPLVAALPFSVLALPFVADWLVRLNPRFESVGNAVGIFTGRVDTYAAGGGSFATRGDLWRAAWEMGSAAPLFGHGWGSWGFERQRFSLVPLEIADPHNGYLYVFAEAGWVAVGAIYLVPLIAVLRPGVPLWLRSTLIVALLVEVANPNLFRPQIAVVMAPIVVLAVRSAIKDDSLQDLARVVDEPGPDRRAVLDDLRR